MDVTDVLRDRMDEPSGLQTMVTVSLALHVALAAGIVLAPGGWLSRPIERPRNVMTISLSGAGEGPRNGGMTAAPGRAVQTEVPPETLPKREVPQAPAAKTPEMTIPKANARPTKARPEVEQAPPDARGRTATRGAQESPGNAIANVQTRGLGFGLSTGGGPGTGSFLDVADFCCPDYIVIMVERIRANWAQNQGMRGIALIRFTIQRSGQISEASIEKPSGTSSLDLAALRAVLQTKSLPPLPDGFTYRTLPVHLSFEYQ